jgi:hypothetical protein
MARLLMLQDMIETRKRLCTDRFERKSPACPRSKTVGYCVIKTVALFSSVQEFCLISFPLNSRHCLF